MVRKLTVWVLKMKGPMNQCWVRKGKIGSIISDQSGGETISSGWFFERAPSLMPAALFPAQKLSSNTSNIHSKLVFTVLMTHFVFDWTLDYVIFSFSWFIAKTSNFPNEMAIGLLSREKSCRKSVIFILEQFSQLTKTYIKHTKHRYYKKVNVKCLQILKLQYICRYW